MGLADFCRFSALGLTHLTQSDAWPYMTPIGLKAASTHIAICVRCVSASDANRPRIAPSEPRRISWDCPPAAASPPAKAAFFLCRPRQSGQTIERDIRTAITLVMRRQIQRPAAGYADANTTLDVPLPPAGCFRLRSALAANAEPLIHTLRLGGSKRLKSLGTSTRLRVTGSKRVTWQAMFA